MNQVLEQCLREVARAAEQGDRSPWLGAWVPGLLREPDVAGELVRRIAAGGAGDDDGEPPEHVLLADLLDEARRAEEDGRADGGRFVAAVRAEVERLAPDRMTRAGRMALARLHARAQLRAPEPLVAATPADLLDGIADGSAEADELDGELESSLDRFLADCGGDLYQLHAAMQETLATAPDEARNALIHHLASATDHRWQRLTLYWVLDRDPAIRAAVADAWREQARAGALDPAVAARIPLLRSWLPGDEARASLDEALAAVRRRQPHAAPFPDPGDWDEVQVSLPDGAGAQYIAAATAGEGKRRRTWAMVLIKAGHGVRDAYLLRELEPGDEEEILGHFRQSVDAMPGARETVGRVLAGAVAENLAAGDPPAHGLIDVATALGLGELRPQALTPAELRSLLDPAGEMERLSPQKRGRLINQSAEWADDLCTLDSWFEDTAAVERILDATASRPRVRERELRAHLESRREWWAGQCLRAALVLRDGSKPALCSSFLATGAALLDGRDLKKIPLMEQVLSRTVDAWQDRRIENGDELHVGAGGPPGDAVPHESAQAAELVGGFSAAHRETLESFYNDGPGARIWPGGFFAVHGYLFAVVTHPDMLAPSIWLPALLGEDAGDEAGARLPDHDRIKAVAGSLLSLFNRINDQVIAGEPALPGGCVLRQPPVANFWPAGAVGQWSRGFRVARERFGHQLDFLEEVLDDDDPEQQEIILHCGLATTTLEAFSEPDRLAGVLAEMPDRDRLSLEQAAGEVSANFQAHMRVCAGLACMTRDMAGDPEYDSDGDLPPAPVRAPVTPVRREAKTGRNEPCPCGSGRKFKRCCGDPRR